MLEKLYYFLAERAFDLHRYFTARYERERAKKALPAYITISSGFEVYRLGDTFVNRDGEWRVVMTQKLYDHWQFGAVRTTR